MSDTRPHDGPVDEPSSTDQVASARVDDDRTAAPHREDAVWTPDAAADPIDEPRRDVSPADEPRRDVPLVDEPRRDVPLVDGHADRRAGHEDEADDEYVPGSYSTRLYDTDAPAETDRSGTAVGAGAAGAGAVAAGAAASSRDDDTVVVAPGGSDAARQPIFVQAPEAPIARGNRAAAGAIGLLAAIVFAILYLGVALGLSALTGAITGDTLVPYLLTALASWSLWVPTAVFFVAFWLLGAIINRGRWATWVVLGLLVGVAAYGGHIAGVLVQAPFWTLTAREGADVLESQLLAPLAVAAFVIGRELTIWFGAWVARRGRRVTELNAEAQREYERTLEAGPKLYAS